MDTKKCNRCDIEYPLTNFYKHKSNAGGYRPQCKPCFLFLSNNSWKNTRKEKRELAKVNKPKELTIEEKKELNKIRRRVANRGPDYAKAQREQRARYYSDPQKNLARVIRRRLYMARKAGTKKGKTLEYLGCSWAELKLHLESLFKPGMTWDNYGQGGWHIDHIKPLCAFDLTNQEDLKIVCHYTNLQPLWQHENIAKIQQDIQCRKPAW